MKQRLFASIFLASAGLCVLAAPGFSAPAAVVSTPSQKHESLSGRGVGIAVCEPAAVPGDPSTGNFGTGCALWLQMVVGGQPEFGRTPLWRSLGRARRELGRPDLRLAPPEARRLASLLGVTDVAVGTLRGTGTRLTLTYRLLPVPTGASTGTAMMLTGTRDQIAAGLPRLARTLAKSLGAAVPAVPASADLTPADLQFLGRLRWESAEKVQADRTQGESLAARSPLAGLMLIGEPVRSAARFNVAVQVLIAQAGGNPLVWGEITEQRPLAALPLAATLAALAARYPGSDILAAAETYRFRAVQDRVAERRAAERGAKDNPQSPDAWLTLTATLDSAAEGLRQARVYDALSPEEAATLTHLYAQWEAAARRSVTLDPAFARGWLRLAQAATFSGDSAVADKAIETALALSDDKSEVYAWALEMYQPKWDDDPAKLAQYSHLAAADMTLDAAETMKVAKELGYSGSPDLRTALLNSFITRQRAYLAGHSDDGNAEWGLAEVEKAAGQTLAAQADFRAALPLLPESAAVRYEYGNTLYAPETDTQAAAQLKDAVHIDPDDPAAHYYLGYYLLTDGKYEDAKAELQAALRLNPAFGDAHGTLGEILLRQNKLAEAVSEYQAALRLDSHKRVTCENLVFALNASGRYAEAQTAGEAALRIYITGDGPIYDNMADAALHTKDWDKSLALSQAALALNPNDALAHENAAEADLGAGRIPDAQAEWRKVLTFTDDHLKTVAQGYLNQYPEKLP